MALNGVAEQLSGQVRNVSAFLETMGSSEIELCSLTPEQADSST